MSDIDKRISDALKNSAEYLVMGEIVAHTGLLVSQSPRSYADYDIIVNNIDLSSGCMVKVKHSRNKFKMNIKNTRFDFLIFVYAPSKIENGIIKPKYGRESDKQTGADYKRGLYVFPKDVVISTLEGESETSFNPMNIKVNGSKDEDKYKEYRNAFHLILDVVPISPPEFS